MKDNKKGVIEVQFNYIFIIIVGAIILAFFISVAGWYMNKTEEDIARDALRNIEAIATGAAANSDTNSQYEVPNIQFNFECSPDCSNSGCYSTIDFENKLSKSQEWLEVEAVFGPSKIKDDIMITWSLSWEIPHRIADFLYITSGDVQYVIIGDNSLANAVYGKMRENKHIDIIKQDAFSSTSINQKKRIKLLYFVPVSGLAESNLKTFLVSNKDRVDGITYFSGDEKSGTATFYEYVKEVGGNYNLENQGSYGYLMMESLIGAAYSSDVDFYKCNMKKAMLRSRVVSKIYTIRANKLAADGECIAEYRGAAEKFNAFSGMYDASTNTFNANMYSGMVNSLESSNKLLLQRSCIRIY